MAMSPGSNGAPARALAAAFLVIAAIHAVHHFPSRSPGVRRQHALPRAALALPWTNAYSTGSFLGRLKVSNALKVIEQGKLSNVLNQLDFPRVVVVGDENAGKSSTLVRIFGVDVLPREDGLCTRQPIVVKLRYDEMFNSRLHRLILRIPGCPPREGLTEQDVREEIFKHMSTIAERKQGLEIKEEVVVEVRSSGVPSMDFVDLPGLIAVKDAGGGQRNDLDWAAVQEGFQTLANEIGRLTTREVKEKAPWAPIEDFEDEARLRRMIPSSSNDMSDLSRICANNYLKDSQTGVVVCVIDAGIDNMRTSLALSMVQDMSGPKKKKKKKYTMGVLAKADRAYMADWEDEGRSSPYWKVEDRLNGASTDYVALDYGYVAVKNSNTKSRASPASLEEHKAQEMEFFEKAMPRAKKVGVDALVNHIDDVLFEHLRQDYLPKKLLELTVKHEACLIRLERLGNDPKNLSVPAVVDQFCSKIPEHSAQCFTDLMRSLKQKLSINAGSKLSCRYAQVKERMSMYSRFQTIISSPDFTESVEKALQDLVTLIFVNNKAGDVRLCRFTALCESLVRGMKAHIRSQRDTFANEVASSVESKVKTEWGCTYEKDTFIRNLCSMADDLISWYFLSPLERQDICSSFQLEATQLVEDNDCAEMRKALSLELKEIQEATKELSAIQQV